MYLYPDVLKGPALNYAYALAKGLHVNIGKADQGTSRVVLTDVAGVWRKFDPLSDTKLIDRMIKDHKLRVYELGHGWSARSSGSQVSAHAMSREEAVLRCLVKVRFQDVVCIPDDLLRLDQVALSVQ